MGQKNFRDLTTFRIGGVIKNYREVKSKDEISVVISFAKKNKLPIFILGDGSDILVSDKDFEGMVIKYVGNSISRLNNILTVEAGMNWDSLVEYSVKNNLQGMECLSGIPGTVGSSPIQNIGAYGQELKDTFLSLTAYDIEKETFIKFSKNDCEFGYRESFFKKKENWQKYVICDVTFKLSTYKDKDLKLQDIRNEILRVRSEKFENPKEVGNAGSFFKNPIINSNKKDELEKKFPDIKTFSFDDKYKISAGWLIEKAGWKGKKYKTAGVSPRHALILINPEGTAKAEDVFDLSEKIIEDVNNKFDIKLEREVQLINF